MKGRASPSPSEGGDVQIGCWLGVYCWWSEIASLGGGDVPGGDLMLGVGIKERGRKMDQSLMFNARNSEG